MKMRKVEVVQAILTHPDCRDGKHGNCDGTGWDVIADKPCDCPCACHTAEPCLECGCTSHDDPDDKGCAHTCHKETP